MSYTSESVQQCIFTAEGSSFKHIFYKYRSAHIRKFSQLINKQSTAIFAPAPDTKKFILNLSTHVLTVSEAAALKKR
jgi:hypothetical protein